MSPGGGRDTCVMVVMVVTVVMVLVVMVMVVMFTKAIAAPCAQTVITGFAAPLLAHSRLRSI